MNLFGLFRRKKYEEKRKSCFFERDRTCDVTCRAFTERKTCAIQDRLKEKRDPKDCAAMLKAMCDLDRDPERLARDYPELFPPPKLVSEE